jgi:hypothetical protein
MIVIPGHDNALTPVQRRAWRKALTYPDLPHDTLAEMIDDLDMAWQFMIAIDTVTIVQELKRRRR